MTEKDLQIQDLKADNEKLKEEIEQIKQPRAAVDTSRERLTIEYDGHYVPKELCTIDRLGGADDCEPCHENCDKDCSKCAVQKCFDKLAEYENLEEQGLLLKLPCNVGDTVYTNFAMQGWYMRRKDRPHKAKIVFIGINGVDNFMNVDLGKGAMLSFKFSEIGKNVFLTEQEAQSALEKMKGE